MSRIYYPGIRLDAGTAQWRGRLYFRFIDKVFQAMATKTPYRLLSERSRGSMWLYLRGFPKST